MSLELLVKGKSSNKDASWFGLDDIYPTNVHPITVSNGYHSWSYGKDTVVWTPSIDVSDVYDVCVLHYLATYSGIDKRTKIVFDYDPYGIVPSALGMSEAVVADLSVIDPQCWQMNKVTPTEAADGEYTTYVSLSDDIIHMYEANCKYSFLFVSGDDLLSLASLFYLAFYHGITNGKDVAYRAHRAVSSSKMSVIEFQREAIRS